MRPKIIRLIVLLNFSFMVYTKDMITIDFIKSYIQNENKPTNLVYRSLCWQKSKTLKLTTVLSDSLNIRTSLEYRENDHLQDHTIVFLVDLDCMQSVAVFNDSTLLRSPYRWLVLSDHQTQNQSQIQHLLDLPLLVDSDFVLAERNEDNFTLTELHKPSTFGPTCSNPRGQYNGKASKLTDNRAHRELFRRRRDIMGHPLTMSNVIQDSNSTRYHLPREDRLEIQYDYIAKLSWTHVHIAFRMLNATPRYIFSYRWGYKRNGEWSGMINDINTGRADLGTNCVAVSERLAVVAFTDSIAKFKVKFIFRQPPLSYVSNIFTLPFTINVWLAVIFTVIISSIIMCIATKWETSRIGTNQTQLDGGISDAIFLSISALSQQGCPKEPKKLSGRITLLVVFTALMALYAAYSANIVVLLQAPSTAIETLEQLAHSKMTLAALDVDYNRFVLKAQKDPARRLIYKKVEPVKGKVQYYKLNDGVELIRQFPDILLVRQTSSPKIIKHSAFLICVKKLRLLVTLKTTSKVIAIMCPLDVPLPYLLHRYGADARDYVQGHFAFHSAAESVYHRIEETFLESEKCDLMEVDFMNAPDPFVPVYKHSPYLELLRVAFKRIRESGIQAAQHKRLQVPKPRCSHRISSFNSVGLLHLGPVLLFMVYGIGVAVLILLAEILTHKLSIYYLLVN